MKNVRKKDQSISSLCTIAIAKEQERLLAAKVRKNGGDFEVLWTKDGQSLQGGFGGFDDSVTEDDQQAVVFESSGVIFYRIEMPQAETEVFEKMVRVQAESKLPLPTDEIETAWRVDKQIGGQVPVTIAAARKNSLRDFINEISPLEPEKIILDYEAIAKVWREFFSGNNSAAMVLSVTDNCTKVCMVENGQLIRAVSLNIGSEKFSSANTETTRRFVQDLAGVVEMFGFESPKIIPIFILTDGSEILNKMTDYLNSAGFRATAPLPKDGNIDIYKYRIPIGAAMVAADDSQEWLDIFKNIYIGKGKKKEHLLLSLKPACFACIAAAILFVIMLYMTDAASLARIEKKLSGPDIQADFQMLMVKQNLKKQAALSRPNFLKLLKDISSSGKDGIKLTGFDFKRTQKIVITGTAQQDKQLYEFQKKLQSEKDISEVKIQSADKDSKSKRINFIINLHYRNFTKKGLESLVF
ncbi:MAG: PilN domain-containing protein [Anaerohalosphaeraceae bacterium]|nr:PilN domain-containing protein [Anaerohalosphaeraceae bacterium]